MPAFTGGIPASEDVFPLASSGQGGSIGTVLPGEEVGASDPGDPGDEPVAPSSSSAPTGWGQPWGFLWGGSTLGDEAAADGQARLLKQWREGPNIRTIADLTVRPFGESLELGLRILNGFDLDTAVGQQLDVIGAMVTLPRLGDSDFRYRQALRAWALVLKSRGTVDEILEIARTFLGPGPTLLLVPIPPMGYRLEVDNLDVEDLRRLVFFVRKATAAAYGFAVVVTLDTSALLGDLVPATVANAHNGDVIGVAVVDPGIGATIYT